MIDNSYTTEFTVPRPSSEVYAAVCNPRAWWNADIVGDTNRVGDEFTHEVPGLHRAQFRITEAEPGRRMVWHVLASEMTFLADDRGEWVGTDLIFDIESDNSSATLRFTHDGLIPDHDCYDICENAWGGYMASLQSLIITGVGRPNQERESH